MREDRRARIVAALLWLAAAAAPALAQEKALHWRALEVRARLDAQGRLEVVERHAMIFTGDWNGGERTFRLFSGQKLDLTRIARVDPQTGEARALAPGDLSQVDHYGWKDDRTLRWRSRLPADPPYNNTEIVTELGYTLSGVLSKEGDVYVLDHDFAFPDRPGAIETFSLDLSLDPAWRPAGSFAAHQERKALLPGESDVVTLRLQYVGAGRPASLRPGASSAERRAVFFLLAASVAGLLLAFRRREAALGRLSPLISDSSIDARWLEANVFSLRPEEVGALWHESVGAPEVAALLARLTADGKIQTRAEGKKMTLKRLVAPEKLEDYERKLVVRLFFGDREETDTDAIRAHYRSKGFDPAALIR